MPRRKSSKKQSRDVLIEEGTSSYECCNVGLETAGVLSKRALYGLQHQVMDEKKLTYLLGIHNYGDQQVNPRSITLTSLMI